jgi:calcium-dependent protein kinase
MGNCSQYLPFYEPEESINSTIKISTDTILGKYTQVAPVSSFCCYKPNVFNNQNLLDNIQLTNKQKKLFEKKITRNRNKMNNIIKKTSTNTRNLLNMGTNNDTLTLTLLSVSSRLFINEIDYSPEKKYKLISNIGQGSYGNVYLACNVYTNEKVAIKKIYKTLDIITESEIINEIDILKKLNHPDIVKILEFYKTETAYYIISEYCSGGELFEKAETHLSENQIAVIFKQILSGLSYLHSNNIVHRDLKLENILISDKEYVPITGEEYLDIKIIDFGNAKHFEKNIKDKSIVGSTYYIAPETFMKKSGKESDLWSAGVILYMLIVGSPPFSGESDKKIFSSVRKGVYDKNYSRWKNASSEVKDLIEKLLVSDPKKRLSAKEALEHVWFNKYQSNALYYNISKNEILQCIQNLLSYDVENKFQELVLAYIIHNMPKINQTKIAIQLFKLANTNGDGKLQKNELKKVLLYFVSEEYLTNFDKIFELLDSENKGYIEYSEFLRASLDRKSIVTEENLKSAFNFFDKENRGYFDEEQMKNFFENKINEQLSHLIFEEIDLNNDGKIDFQVFKNIMI